VGAPKTKKSVRVVPLDDGTLSSFRAHRRRHFTSCGTRQPASRWLPASR
jgi:hypothetical protein